MMWLCVGVVRFLSDKMWILNQIKLWKIRENPSRVIARLSTRQVTSLGHWQWSIQRIVPANWNTNKHPYWLSIQQINSYKSCLTLWKPLVLAEIHQLHGMNQLCIKSIHLFWPINSQTQDTILQAVAFTLNSVFHEPKGQISYCVWSTSCSGSRKLPV